MKKLYMLLAAALLMVVTSCGGGGDNAATPSLSAKDITAFSLGGFVGTINKAEKTIEVTVPSGTSVLSMVATFTTTGESVKVASTMQTSGTTANDFTNPVIYTVTAKDSSTQDYTVSVIGTGSVSIKYIGFRPMGYFEVIMNYKGDNDYHMGQLYGKALGTLSSRLEAGFADYFSNPINLGAVDYDTIMTRIQQIKNQVPKEYRDFLDGMASQFKGGTTNDKGDHVLSVDEIYYFSLAGSVVRTNQCSAMAVYGTSSYTNKSIIGRLFDWGSGESYQAVIYINKDNKAIINIGGLFQQNVATGLNKDGIFVAILDSETGTAFPDLSLDTYYAHGMDIRYALENYSTINDIASYLSKNKYTFNHLVLIGDSNTVKILENDLDGTRALRDASSELNAGITWGFPNAIGAVNAFILKNNHDNFSANSSNTYRWQSIKDQLNLYLLSDNKITVDEMKKITTYYGTDIYRIDDGAIMTPITQYIIVYDSYTSSLHAFFRSNRTIGTENNTTSFDVNNPEFLVIPVRF